MKIGIRLLFFLSGILLGMFAKQYFVGVYSIIFQTMLWTVIIALLIHKYKSSSKLDRKDMDQSK